MLELPQCSTWLEDILTSKDFDCPIREMDVIMMPPHLPGYPDDPSRSMEIGNQRLIENIRNETLRLYPFV